MKMKIIRFLNFALLCLILFMLTSCIMLPKQTASLYEDVYQTKLSVNSLDKKLSSYNENMNQSLKTLSEESNTSAKTTNRNLADLNERVMKIEENIRKLQAKIDELVFYINKDSSKVSVSEEGEPVATSTSTAPSSTQSDMLQGKKLYNQGEYQKAIDIFNNVLTRNPAPNLASESYYHIGQCYFYLNDYDNAIKNFNQILTDHSEDELAPYAMLRLGDSYLKLNNKEEARKNYQGVLEKYPNFKEAELVKAKIEETK